MTFEDLTDEEKKHYHYLNSVEGHPKQEALNFIEEKRRYSWS